LIFIHDRQHRCCRLLECFQRRHHRISLVNHSRIGAHEIRHLFLPKSCRGSINKGIAFIQREVLDRTPAQEVAQRQTILSYGVKGSFVQGEQRRGLKRRRIKLALQLLEKLPLAETVTGRQCANRPIPFSMT
jgi:hypothetical protein